MKFRFQDCKCGPCVGQVVAEYLFHDRIALMYLTPDETLLGLLQTAPQHGYQLLEHFRRDDRLGHVWKLSTSQLYAVLKRLEQQGMIAGMQIETDNAPPRTEYHLTPAGAERLHAWLYDSSPSASVRRVRVEFLSRLYIARLLGLDAAPIVGQQKTMCMQHLAELRTELAHTSQGIDRLAVALVIAQLEAIIHWIDTVGMQR